MKNISNSRKKSKETGNITVQFNTTLQTENLESSQIGDEKEEGQVPLNLNAYKKSSDKKTFLKKVFLSGVRHAQFDGEVSDVTLKVLYEILRVMGFEANEFQLQEGYRYACFQAQYGNDLDKFTKSGTNFRRQSRERVDIKQIKQRFDIDEYLIWFEKNWHHLRYDTTLHFHYMRNVRRGIYQIEKEDIKLPAFFISEQDQSNLHSKYKTPLYMTSRADSPSLIDPAQERTFKYYESKNKKFINDLENKRLDFLERQKEYSERQRRLAKDFFNYHNNKYSPKKYAQVTMRVNTQGDFTYDSKEQPSVMLTNNRCQTQYYETEGNDSQGFQIQNSSPQKILQFSPETMREEELKSEFIENNSTQKNASSLKGSSQYQNNYQKLDEPQKSILKNNIRSLNTSPNFSPTRAQSQSGRYFISTRSDEKKNTILVPKESQKLKLQRLPPPQIPHHSNTIQDFCEINVNSNYTGKRISTMPNSPTQSQVIKDKERNNRKLAQAKQETDKRVTLILKNLKEMTELRQENAVIPYDLRSQSEISEAEDKKELAKINIIPYQAELYDLNKELTKLKGETQVDIASLINRIKQNNRIRDDIQTNIEEIAEKRMRNNEIIGKQGAIKAKRRLSECSYSQKKKEIKDLKYQALHDKDQTRQYRIEHFLSRTSNPTSKSPSHLQSLQNSPHITPKFKKKIGDLLSQNPF